MESLPESRDLDDSLDDVLSGLELRLGRVEFSFRQIDIDGYEVHVGVGHPC